MSDFMTTIYTIRTTSGREDVVIDMLESNIKADKIDIKSVFHPAEIKGYVFVEGTLGAVQKAMHGLMHANETHGTRHERNDRMQHVEPQRDDDHPDAHADEQDGSAEVEPVLEPVLFFPCDARSPLCHGCQSDAGPEQGRQQRA